MKSKKVFYIIEPIDIDGDKIHDGFLASQYRIDKYGNKIFLKNKYISFADFNSKINKNGGAKKRVKIPKVKLQKNNNNLIVMTKDEYNNFMNQNAYYQQYPNNQYNQYPQYPQNPPKVLINSGNNIPYNPNNQYNQYNGNDNSFMGNMTSGLGLGVGLGFGMEAGESLFNGLSEMF